jgi:DNA-binding MarR family transcriptional regulator
VTDTSWNRLFLMIFRLHGQLLQHGDAVTAPLGLSSARWQVLGALRDGPRSVPQVARQMGLSRQAVQRTMGGLEEKALVVAQRNPDHRTSPLFGLTDRGRTLLEQINAVQANWLERLAGRLPGDGETEAALRVLARLAAVFEEDEVLAEADNP